MKKKIGDLTLREITEICHKNFCNNCPFRSNEKVNGRFYCSVDVADYNTEYLDQEVEIEVEE